MNLKRKSKGRCPATRLRVEQLEARLVLSSLFDYDAVSPDWFRSAGAGDHDDVPPPGAETPQSLLSSGPSSSSQPTNQWIVRLTEEATRELSGVGDAGDILNTPHLSLQVVRGLGLPGQLLVSSTLTDPAQIQAALADNPGVASFDFDAPIHGQQTPDDSLYSSQAPAFEAIRAAQAWDTTTGEPSVVVAVLDTGIDTEHPDLDANLWVNEREIPGNFLDDDGNGFIDDRHGCGFENGVDLGNGQFLCGPLTDGHGHGTHIAGTIGAEGNNGLGVTGVNWQTSLMVLKVLDDANRGRTSDAIRAVNYVTMMSARARDAGGPAPRVINASWGSNQFDANLREAMSLAGEAEVLVVAGAGNGNALLAGVDNDGLPFYPASFELDNVISVASTDAADELARRSNFGVSSVDLAAPGVGILSTAPGGGYSTRNGTSMATAHVSGAAALVLSDKPGATVGELRRALLESVDPLAQLSAVVASGGRLNVEAALMAETFAPQAELDNEVVVVPDADQLTIRVRYTDDEGVDAGSLDDRDLVVTREGFRATRLSTELAVGSKVVHQVGAGGEELEVTVEYLLSAPAGGWRAIDNGQYSIVLQAGEVNDIGSIATGERALGQFAIQIEDPSVFFVDTADDTPDAAVGDGLAQDSRGRTSLRAAVQEANANVIRRTVVASLDVPVSAEETVTSDLDVASLGVIQDVDVTLSITHPRPEDLVVSLIHPEGQAVRLFESIGENSGDFPGTTLDDEADDEIAVADAPFAGRYVPQEPLAEFDGMQAHGVWQLEVTAEGSQDIPTIVSWSLDLETQADRTVVIPDGVYSLTRGGANEDAGVTGDLDVSTVGVNLLGSGIGNTIVESSVLDRVFDTHAGGSTVVSGVTFRGGTAGQGGAVRNLGVTTLERTRITNNVATNRGGGVYSAGQLVVRESEIDGNQTTEPFGTGGGGVYSSGPLIVERSTIAENTSRGGAVSTGGGGGLLVTDLAAGSISNSTISGNVAVNGDGGGIHLLGSVQSINNTIADNHAPLGRGGGVFTGRPNPDPAFEVALAFSTGSERPAGEIAQLNGLTVGPDGRIYTVDRELRRVQVFSATGEIEFAFGELGTAPGDFQAPVDVAVDGDGNIYVADTVNNRIQVYGPTGQFRFDFEARLTWRIALDADGNIYSLTRGLGVQVYSSEGVPTFGITDYGGLDTLGFGDIAIDAQGRIVLSENDKDRMVILTHDGTKFVPTVVPIGSSRVGAIGTDSQGNIYASDLIGRRVLVYDDSGSQTNDISLTGFSGASISLFASDQGLLYVGPEFDTVKVVDLAGALVLDVGQSAGTSFPKGAVDTDADDRIYVTDRLFDRVRVFDAQGSFLREFGATGAEPLQDPQGVAIQPTTGRVVVADTGNDRLQFFDSDGNLLAIFGETGFGLGQFSRPTALAADQAGQIFIADTGNNRVQLMTTEDQFFALGFAFMMPRGVAVDSGGRLHVVDSGRIVRFTSSLELDSIIEDSLLVGLDGPIDLDVDLSGRIYVPLPNGTVQVFGSNGARLETIGGQSDGDGTLSQPTGVAIDSLGRIVVAEDQPIVEVLRRIPVGTLFAVNTLVAGNRASGNGIDSGFDVFGPVFSQGTNLVGIVGDNASFSGNTVLDQFGSPTVPLDALLEPLAFNGGTTRTHALLPDSSAIDRAASILTTDQRGVDRPQDGDGSSIPVGDIGAVELYLGTIRGQAFIDRDGDGMRDAEEPGLAGLRVFVDLDGNERLSSHEPTAVTSTDDPATTTDETGAYVFKDLGPGSYVVRSRIPQQVEVTAPQVSDATSVIHTGLLVGSDTVSSTLRDGLPSIDDNTVLLGARGTGVYTIDLLGVDEVPRLLESSAGLLAGTTHSRGNVAIQDPSGLVTISPDDFGRVLVELGVTRIPRTPNTFEFMQAPVVAGDLIAFWGAATQAGGGHSGLYLTDTSGELVVIVDELTPVPGASAGTFFTIFPGGDPYPEVSVDSTRWAFAGGAAEKVGIFVGGRETPLHAVVDSTMAVPGGGIWSSFGGVHLVNDEVTFCGTSTGSRTGIYRAVAPGIVTEVASNTTAVPGGAGLFSSFDCANNAGEGSRYAFVATSSTGAQGLYLSLDGQLRKVIDTTDSLPFGEASVLKTPSALSIGLQAIDRNSIVFRADFPDGTHAIYVSTLEATHEHLVELSPGIERSGIDFGIRPYPGSIRGHKFHDTNEDGKRDAGEPGLAGWTIYLDQNGNRVREPFERSTVTGADGSFEFANLATLEDYTVAVEPQTEWELTSPSPDIQGGTWEISLEAGQERRRVDFGSRPATDTGGVGEDDGLVAGRVYLDVSANGVYDPGTGDVALAGREVFLDLNDNQAFDLGEPIQTTGPAGEYSFTGLAGRVYAVRLVQVAGSRQVAPQGNRLVSTNVENVTSNPESLAEGDFDGDGDRDLVVTANSSNDLWLLTNDGSGDFDQKRRITETSNTDNSPSAVVTGDFDRDGRVDVAIANFNSNSVQLYYNDTDYSVAPAERTVSFANPIRVTLPASAARPFSLTTADFNGDNHLDLAVARFSFFGGDVSILLNDTTSRNFTVGTPIPSGDPRQIVAGHFNDDALVDLAVANGSRNNVQFLLGDGTGGFDASASPAVDVGSWAVSVSAARLNDDAIDDLVVSNILLNRVSLIVSDGSTHRVLSSEPTSPGPTAAVLVDLDSDNDLDIAVTTNVGRVDVLRNQGDNTFAAPENFGIAVLNPTPDFGLLTADFDNDLDADLAIARGNSNSVAILDNLLVAGAHRVTVSSVTPNHGGLDFLLEPPSVTLEASESELPEATGQSVVTATLSTISLIATTVQLGFSGTAVAGTDYTPGTAEIVIPAGSLAGSFILSAVDDSLDEPDETVTIEIAAVVGANELASQQVTLTILDDDLPPSFAASSFAALDSGFRIHFTRSFDPDGLNLYDTRAISLGLPDVTVTGALQGNVTGSLMPGTATIEFIRSGGRLAQDTYTVRLRSAPDGFRDVSGMLLDGDRDGVGGDDYVQVFTVGTPAAGARVVSIPDFVRGPRQPVNLPADATAGLPVMISDGADVHSVDLSVRYDPGRLQIHGATTDTGATITLDTTSEPGVAQLSVRSATPLPSGPITLAHLQATVVDEGANYGSSHVLDLHSIRLADGSDSAIPAIADDSLHFVAYFGDVTGNGRINAADAAQIARGAALIDSGFVGSLLVDPLVMGDISGNRRLNAGDASLLARFAAFLPTPQIPPIPPAGAAAAIREPDRNSGGRVWAAQTTSARAGHESPRPQVAASNMSELTDDELQMLKTLAIDLVIQELDATGQKDEE